jgi:ketosteroid isomerase-like protein
MSDQENVAAVQRMYCAFGSGDIPALLAELADDVDWSVAGSTNIPYAGSYRGHDGVMEFFHRLVDAIDIEQFEPREFIAQGAHVAVLGHEAGRAKPTGCRFENSWAQVFSFGGDKVVRFHEYVDTAALEAAFKGDCQA